LGSSSSSYALYDSLPHSSSWQPVPGNAAAAAANGSAEHAGQGQMIQQPDFGFGLKGKIAALGSSSAIKSSSTTDADDVAALAGYAVGAAEQHLQQQQQQQQQTLVLQGDPFGDIPQMPQKLQQLNLSSKDVAAQLAKWKQQGFFQVIEESSGTGKHTGRLQAQRVYVKKGFFHFKRNSSEVHKAIPSSEHDKQRFVHQQMAGAGCMMVRVLGPKPPKSGGGAPVQGAAVAALQDELNLHSLVLLAWRLQHEPGFELGWLDGLLSVGKVAAPVDVATDSQQARSNVRRQLHGAALNSR
jgi:hypothetical protein